MAAKLLHYTTSWPSGLNKGPASALSLTISSPPSHKAGGLGERAQCQAKKGRGHFHNSRGNRLQKGTICDSHDSHVPFEVLLQKKLEKEVGGGAQWDWYDIKVLHLLFSITFPIHFRHIEFTCSGNWVNHVNMCTCLRWNVVLLVDAKQLVCEHILTWVKFLSTIEIS